MRSQQGVIDVPGIHATGRLLEDGLDQLALERIELPYRHPLALVPQLDRQQVAGLDLVGDPAARLAGQLGVVGHHQVVRPLEDFQQLQALALQVRELRLRVFGHLHG